MIELNVPNQGPQDSKSVTPTEEFIGQTAAEILANLSSSLPVRRSASLTTK